MSFIKKCRRILTGQNFWLAILGAFVGSTVFLAFMSPLLNKSATSDSWQSFVAAYVVAMIVLGVSASGPGMTMSFVFFLSVCAVLFIPVGLYMKKPIFMNDEFHWGALVAILLTSLMFAKSTRRT